MVVIMEENVICRRCHRKLVDEKSKNLGFGSVCYKKYLARKRNFLFDIDMETMKVIEKC